MKNLIFLLMLLSSEALFAQYGQVNNVTLYPPNPSNADSIYVIADVSFGFDNCSLLNTYSVQIGDTLLLSTNYCLGNVVSNCNSIDTINFGVFPAGNYIAIFKLAVRPNNCQMPSNTIVLTTVDTINVTMFTGNGIKIEKSKFNLFPNPTHDSEINISVNTNLPYQVTCYNSLGELMFERCNLINSKSIVLPDNKGVYLIKIVDDKNQLHFFKIISNQELKN